MDKWYLGLLQAVLGALGFVVIKYFDDKAIINNPLVERLRGWIGTICLLLS